MPAKDTYARFYIHPSLQGDKSYKDVLMAEIYVKGSTNTSFSRPKKDEDEKMYEAEWTAYENHEDYVNSGTPLTALPRMGPSQEMNLKATGIHSVEDLAELSDNVVIGVRGMLDARKMANAYLEALHPEKLEAERQASLDKENEMSDTIKLLTLEMAQMKEALKKATIPHKGKKGKK